MNFEEELKKRALEILDQCIERIKPIELLDVLIKCIELIKEEKKEEK